MRTAEQVFECPDHPDVLFEQVGWAAGAFGTHDAVEVRADAGLPAFVDAMAGDATLGGEQGGTVQVGGQLDAAAERGKRDTRHYAKRQFTWFRHQLPEFEWVKLEQARQWLSAQTSS